MFFNYSKGIKDLTKQHEQERKLLTSAGVSPQEIEQLFEFDKQIIRKTRNFYRYLDSYPSIYDLPENILDNIPIGDYEIEEHIEDVLLYRALKSLTVRERQIIQLRIAYDLPFSVIAELLRLPYKPVKQRYKRAVAKLRKIFLKNL